MERKRSVASSATEVEIHYLQAIHGQDRDIGHLRAKTIRSEADNASKEVGMFRVLNLTRRSRLITLLAVLGLGTTAALAFFAFGFGSTAFGHGDNSRPHEIGENEGYGNEKVLVFFYPQQFHCTDEAFDDLDGPGHEGDGIVAAKDPDEFQHPSMGPPGSPCIVGQTASGSLPTIDPTGDPTRNAEPVWAILPFFDANANGVIDAFDPTIPGTHPPGSPAIDVQCPEPGLPYTEHKGAFATCAMHPHTLHAEPAVADGVIPGDELPTANPAGDIPLPNHSHIIDGDNFNPIWWQTIGVRVTDRSIWPDFDGRCPANPQGGKPCLTSLQALRDAQARGQASPDAASNVWLFFDSHQVDPQP
jgi:hypothetical protein